jgi:hypothetical protein
LLLKKLILLLITVTPLMIFQACSETPTGAGAGLLEQDLVNLSTLDTAADTVEITAAYQKRTINLGTSTRILVGRRENIEAGILIRFQLILPDTLSQQIRDGSVTVESSNITMTRNYLFGSNDDPLNFNVYNITSGWTTVGFNSDSAAALQYENIDRLTGLSIDTITTRLDIQPQLALNWLQAAADPDIPADNGAYIKPAEGSNKILGYYAIGSDEALTPKLNIVYRNALNELDTVVYNTFADLSFVTGELPQISPQNIAVQAGLEITTRIRFELSSIPENSIINKAELTFTKDVEETRVGDSFVNQLVGFFIADSLNPDSVSGSVTLSGVNNSFTGDVTLFVQQWVRSRNNYGLLIVAGGRFTGVELFSLYGPAADQALRPRLNITYTTKL